jgi:hypothetical protein
MPDDRVLDNATGAMFHGMADKKEKMRSASDTAHGLMREKRKLDQAQTRALNEKRSGGISAG